MATQVEFPEISSKRVPTQRERNPQDSRGEGTALLLDLTYGVAVTRIQRGAVYVTWVTYVNCSTYVYVDLDMWTAPEFSNQVPIQKAAQHRTGLPYCSTLQATEVLSYPINPNN